MQWILTLAYNFITNLIQVFFDISNLQRERNQKLRISKNKNPAKKVLWIHGASTGEIDIVLPLINRFQNDYEINVSFFSISGLKHFRNYALFNHIFLLPVDTKKNALNLLNNIRPDLVLWMNNELWLNSLTEINNKKIPLFLINASFSKDDKYNYILNKYQYMCLDKFTAIHASIVNPLLEKLNIVYNIIPNLKIERSLQNTCTIFSHEQMESCLTKGKILILGSVYLHEISSFLKRINEVKENYYLWIFPHKLDKANITSFQKIINKFQGNRYNNANIILFEKPHLLRYAYRYADCVYVGGGFNRGVHNIFEAFVYNKFIVTGYNYNYHKDVRLWMNNNNIIVTESINKAVETCNKILNSNDLPLNNDFNNIDTTNKIYNWINNQIQ